MHYLEEIGLTKGEIKVYLSLLTLGQATSGPIIAESKISSSKVYEIMEKLMQKGLASVTVKNKTKYFQATSPSKLREYLNVQEKKVTEQKHELEKHLPELAALYKEHKAFQNAEIFTGTTAIKTMLWDMVEHAEKGDEWLFFSGTGEAFEKATEKIYFQFRIYRQEKGMVSKGIAQESQRNTQPTKSSTTTPIFRYTNFPTPSNITIYKNQVSIISWESPIAILITSEDIAKRFKAFFESVWAIARK